MRLAWAAVLVVGCKYQIDNPPLDAGTCSMNSMASVCTQEAAALTDCSQPTSGCFKFIKEKIFDKNCNTSSCHDRMGAGKLELSTDGLTTVTQDEAYANLGLGSGGSPITSDVDMNYKLVIPGKPEQSYLAMMVQGIPATMMDPPAKDPPSKIGYMPKDTASLFCCQKADLVVRWIQAGAPNN